MNASANPSPTDADRYTHLLREAASLRGVSLGRDAWRRLRRNRPAYGSLCLLVIVAIIAVLAPALPFQSPILQDLEKRKNLPPRLTPQRLRIKDSQTDLPRALTVALREYRDKEKRLRKELAADQASKQLSAAEAAERNDRLREHIAAHPYNKLWHNPGAVTRAMIDLRLAVFGDWCFPSIVGTDDLGRDMLTRIVWGGRVSLAVGIVASLVSLLIGVTWGSVAGYLGGWIDEVMMRAVDVLYAIPFIYIAIFVISLLNEEKFRSRYLDPYGITQIHVFYLLIGAIYWLTMARVVRGQVLSLKNEQFIDAARTSGAGSARIIFRHLIPNVLGIVIVYLTLTIPSVMLFEAFLSFLGLGVRPPDVSWGLLMSDGIKVITPIKTHWWLVVFPGLTLTLTLFALNFLGDGLRDAFDPQMKNK